MASTKDYYSDQNSVALTTSFVPQYFGFHASTMVLRNDESGGGANVYWSFDGSNPGGMLKPGEAMTWDILSNGKAVLSLKGSVAGADYRLEVTGI